EQAGDQEVDVARAGLGHEFVAHGCRVNAALGALQSVVHNGSSCPAFGPRGIKQIEPSRARGLPGNDDRDLACAQRLARLFGFKPTHAYLGVRREDIAPRLIFGSGFYSDVDGLGWAIAKSNAESQREHNRKTVRPEQSRGLA